MKRPFALLGGSALAALIFCAVAEEKDLVPAGIILVGAGLFMLFLLAVKAVLKKFDLRFLRRLSGIPCRKAFSAVFLWSALALLTAALCIGRYRWELETKTVPAESLNGQTVCISGTVLDYPEEAYHRYYYRIRVESVTVGELEREMGFTVRVSAQVPFSCSPYDCVKCSVRLSSYDSSGGLYSGRSSYLAKGIAIKGSIAGGEDILVTPGEGHAISKGLCELRRQLGRVFQKSLPQPYSGLIRGLLLGERSQIDSGITDDFRAIGASHLLVISGLHMSALAGLLLFLFRRLSHRVWLQNLLAGLCLVLFLGVICFPASAVRSGVMYLLALAAASMGRETDGINSLGIAVLVICLAQPFSGGDLGLALSVSATLGILVFGNRISRWLIRPLEGFERICMVLKPVAAMLSMSFAAILFTLPLQVFVFGGVSLLAPVSGLLLSLPCMALLYAAFLAALVSLLPVFGMAAAAPFLFCAGWLSKLCVWLAGLLARLPGTFLPMSRTATVVFLLGLLLTAAVCRQKGDRAAACAVLAGALILSGFGKQLELVRRDAVTMAVSSDYSCVLVMKGDRATVILTGGYRSGAASEMLRKNGVRRVEVLLLPVRTQAAGEAARSILESFRTERLAVPEGAYLGRDLLQAAKETEVTALSDDDALSVLQSVELRPLHGMGSLSVSGPGFSAMVEIDDSGGGSCQYLFTAKKHSNIKSTFTILQNDDIMDITELSAGNYIVPAGDGMYLDLFPDGTVDFRGESACLSLKEQN